MVAGFTKRDPFTGQPAKSWEVFLGSFPQVSQFAPGWVPFAPEGSAYKDDGLYSKGMGYEIAKYLGLPIRRVDTTAAVDAAINPWSTVEFSAPAIDTRTESGKREMEELRRKLREQYGNG
jgi:hypothetical protein